MEITKVLMSNYLPYCKGVVIGRAIPGIDGLKPANRRILYTMYTMGLLDGAKSKSARIVGQVMKYHPHGDSAIYETMVRMSTGNEALNVPYVESKGNFGKVYSTDLAYAASRYTEAKLTPICSEIFEGIKEGAVDFIPNFDDTEVEPTLLPVKFPSIIVNTARGIAVGTSSDIPPFALAKVCRGTRGLVDGSITDVEGLMDVLGTPEFTTGGFVHASREDLIKLGKTGKGSFTVSGSVTTYPNKIEINEIPYRTTAEKIIEAIEEHVKDKTLNEVSNVSDDIGLKGFKMTVELKRGANSREVLDKLCRMTDLRMKINFNTRVIIDNKCEEIGIFDLLHRWIEFRLETIRRIHSFRLEKHNKKIYLLEAWEKIDGHVEEVAKIAGMNAEDSEIKAILMKQYNLEDAQAEYLLDNKIRMLSKKNLDKKLAELDKERQSAAFNKNIIDTPEEQRKIIIKDLTEIEKKYGTESRTHMADPIVEVKEGDIKPVIDDSTVSVVLTKSGFIKRLVSIKDINNFELPEGEEIRERWTIKNNDHLLVFTASGVVHKVLVDSINAGKGGLKEKLTTVLGLNTMDEIIYIDSAGDYSGYFNLVYGNGRGVRVNYSKVSGNRSKYKSVYPECVPGQVWITKADKFFMITARRKASYCDLELLGAFSNRVAFKVARIGSGDRIFGLQPIENVPDINAIDLERYKREYCVSIGEDRLWQSPATKKEAVEEVDNQTSENEDIMDKL